MTTPAPLPAGVMTSDQVASGIPAVDAYLARGYDTVPGMSSRFAAAICCGLLRIQSEMGVKGPIAEVGSFEGRFFIALAHALKEGEVALGIDLFDWPNPEVKDRFEANCAKHGVPADKIVARYHRSLALLPDAIARTNRAYFFDTSEEKAWYFARVTDGTRLDLESDEIPQWFEPVWSRFDAAAE